MISLLTVCCGNILGRNETVLPTGFINWGTTGPDRILNSYSNLLLNTNIANSYIQFRGNTQGSNNALIGVLTNDIIIRLPS